MELIQGDDVFGEHVQQPQQQQEQQQVPRNHELMNPLLLEKVSKYLGYKDFMNCRQACRTWNRLILQGPRFIQHSKGKLTESWYAAHVGMDLENSFKWSQLTLNHFTFHRNCGTLKNYWHNAVSTTLSTLIMSKCSFECDAFIFLLNHCSVLNKLIIAGTKLRDLDDFHTVPGRTRVGAPCAHQPLPVTAPIEHFVIDNVYKFEQCFMDYIIARTAGTLKTFSVQKCFTTYDPMLCKKDASRPQMGQMYMEFQSNILLILRLNRHCLEKFSFKENQYQMYFFKALNDATEDLIAVPNLSIALNVAEQNLGYAPLVTWMSKGHPYVQKLSLQFLGYVSNPTFNAILHPFKPTLKELTIVFAGDKMSMLDTEKFDISCVREFTNLDSLVVRDTKQVTARDVRIVLGGRRILSRPTTQRILLMRPHIKRRVDEASFRLSSNLNPSFLTKLPPMATKLSYEQCIFGEEDFSLSIPKTPQGECIVTKISIYGPWIHSLNGIIRVLIYNVPNLESLTLTYCDIDDTDLTGMDALAVLDTRRCLTFGLALLNTVDGRAPRAEDVIQAVEQAVVDRGPIDRPRVSTLNRLKYLDLSGNASISDVTLYDSLRLPNLKNLGLMSNNRITDTGLEFLKLFCPGLEEINLKNCRRISRHGLNQVIRGCPNLKHIYTTRMIADRDAGAFNYALSPNFGDIIVTTSAPRTDEFLLEREQLFPAPFVM